MGKSMIIKPEPGESSRDFAERVSGLVSGLQSQDGGELPFGDDD